VSARKAGVNTELLFTALRPRDSITFANSFSTAIFAAVSCAKARIKIDSYFSLALTSGFFHEFITCCEGVHADIITSNIITLTSRIIVTLL
jgi:hypothetical protein